MTGAAAVLLVAVAFIGLDAVRRCLALREIAARDAVMSPATELKP